ncbi:MAG: cobalamin B12-binding domain-containing protein [Eubacteriales bacterium]
MTEKKVRVLVGKPGLDGHDRGAKVIAKALRDAGFEVIYTGLRNSPEQIVGAAIQEDVDVIGLSILSGAHRRLCRRILDLMKADGLEHVPLLLGGIIPDDDLPLLEEMGVSKVFGPGSNTSLIVDYIRQKVG